MMRLWIGLVLVAAVGLRVAAEEADSLLEAARRGDLEAVQKMIAAGGDVNAAAQFNLTPLWHACSKGHREVAKVLLEAGADPNRRDDVWEMTPLAMADDPALVTLLLKHGAQGADYQLRIAAYSGNAELLQAVLDVVKPGDAALATAKAQAVQHGHLGIAEILESAAGKQLPPPPELTAEARQALLGNYVSERLEDVEVGEKDGQLTFRLGSSEPFVLVARNATTFDMGPFTFEFALRDGEVVSLKQSSLSGDRTYRRASGRDQRPADAALDGSDWKEDATIAATTTWPSFRGIAARGIAVDQSLPNKFDVPMGEAVRWKTPIPGLGNSCPVVWHDQVFLTTAVSSAGNNDLRIGLYGEGDAADDASPHQWQILCLDAGTGEIRWRQTAHEGVPPVKRHLKSSQANSTPATDGRYVVALFNSGGLYCYGMSGEVQWRQDLGRLDSGAFNDAEYQWGFGSSPIIRGDSVIVQCDLQKDSFLAAFEISSGRELWRTPRDELPSWGTPTIQEMPRGPLLITNATNFIRGYDARTGSELWRLGRNAAITVPTPLVGRGLIFVTSGYRPIQPIYAVKLDAVGDITLAEGQSSNDYVAWSHERGGPYLPSPLLYGKHFYTCGNNGVFACYDADTGTLVYRERCGSGTANSFTASLVAADGVIYATAESGDVVGIRAGPIFEIMGKSSLGEYCLATPAIAGGQMLFRTQKHLIAIGTKN